ncbi:ABC transporter permease [Dongia rigui]|uniref:Xylose transport system permease protein XylH n=1 Tax=Dongia rigui TaxID=940149 RepID=A0ABU5E259_9PROT|nr:ABC transporter permease [Dongia rigui]MDY0873683.1 ABC transporter permease [Dongia rigui]
MSQQDLPAAQAVPIEAGAAQRPAVRDERVLKQSRWRQLMTRPEMGAIAGTILVFIFFLAVAGDSGMFSAKGMVNFFEVSAQLGILAAIAALLMIGGEFDLSVGSMIAFSSMVIAIPSMVWGWPLWACILLAFALSALVGFINGLIVVRTGLPSFIVTLAGLFVLRGLTLALTRGITNRTQVSGVNELVATDPIGHYFSGVVFEDFFVWMGKMGWIATRPDGLPLAQGLPISVVWWIGLTAVATWILLRTRFGNWIFATGGDPVAARNVGVPVARVKILLFMAMAMTATLFAAIQVLDSGSADTLRGTQKEFEAIIAVVVGGTLLTGGYGSAVGASFGALIFGTVQMGIFYTGVDTDWFKVFLGVMVLVAVLFNNYVRKRVTGSR